MIYECLMLMLMLCKSSYARLTPEVLQISPQKILDLLQGEFLGKDWQDALCRWFFTADCDDKMVLQYELAFGGTKWWTPFIDKLIVPRLVSWFVAISVVPPNEGYDVFHMLTLGGSRLCHRSR